MESGLIPQNLDCSLFSLSTSLESCASQVMAQITSEVVQREFSDALSLVSVGPMDGGWLAGAGFPALTSVVTARAVLP